MAFLALLSANLAVFCRAAVLFYATLFCARLRGFADECFRESARVSRDDANFGGTVYMYFNDWDSWKIGWQNRNVSRHLNEET